MIMHVKSAAVREDRNGGGKVHEEEFLQVVLVRGTENGRDQKGWEEVWRWKFCLPAL